MQYPGTISRFDGGVADDTRNAAPNEFAHASHFNIYTRPQALIPYRDMETEAGSLSGNNIKSVVLMTDSGGTQAFFALGNATGQTYAQILEKTTIAGTFANSTGGADSTGVVIGTSLYPYKTKLYYLKTLSGNTVLISYDPVANSLATVGTITGISSTGVYPKMFRHPQDDVLYIIVGNNVAKLDNATFTDAALTLPSDLIATSQCDYGVYLAISCAPVDQGKKSYVFFWGRDTSLVEVDETVDAGEGAMMILENLEGELIGVSASGQSAGQTIDIAPKIIISSYANGFMKPFRQILWEGTGTPTTLLANFKAKKNHQLYFAAKQYFENKTVNQIWVVGRDNKAGVFVTPDRLVNNDTPLTGTIDGFSMIGDYTWVAFNADGSLFRTNDAASYTATSIYESCIFNYIYGLRHKHIPDSSVTKKLVGTTVAFEPLPVGATVVLKYRKDEETSWTQIFTYTSTNSVSHSSVNIESTVVTLPEYKEIQFRMESTGGAVITGMKFMFTQESKDVY